MDNKMFTYDAIAPRTPDDPNCADQRWYDGAGGYFYGAQMSVSRTVGESAASISAHLPTAPHHVYVRFTLDVTHLRDLAARLLRAADDIEQEAV